MNAEITEKTELLADAIARSSELAELRSAERALDANQPAQQLIAELQKVQDSFMEKQKNGSGLSETDKRVVEEMESKVEANLTIAAYMKAQNQFSVMLDKINAILAGAIAGSADSCCCGDSACGSGCCSGGSCNGGC